MHINDWSFGQAHDSRLLVLIKINKHIKPNSLAQAIQALKGELHCTFFFLTARVLVSVGWILGHQPQPLQRNNAVTSFLDFLGLEINI